MKRIYYNDMPIKKILRGLELEGVPGCSVEKYKRCKSGKNRILGQGKNLCKGCRKIVVEITEVAT